MQANSTVPASAMVGDSAETMKAIVQSGYGGPEVLRLGRAARPAPGDGEVLVRVHAAGLDRGTWHLMTGRPYLMRLMGFGFSAPNAPVPGLDVAGTVVEIGANVTRLAVGDEVFGIARGSFAELAVARADKLARKPAGVGFEQAAVLGVSAITALQALRDAGRLAAGERVLVVGASGGVGTYALQIARALGADVTGVCSAAKLDLVRSLGAEAIDYRSAEFADGSRQWDLILDAGGNTPLARLRRAMTPTGRLVFVGGEQGGDWTAGFGRPLGALLLGLFVKQRFAMHATKETAVDLERVKELVEAGRVSPSIDRVIPLEGVVDAIRDLEDGRVRGKIAIAIC